MLRDASRRTEIVGLDKIYIRASGLASERILQKYNFRQTVHIALPENFRRCAVCRSAAAYNFDDNLLQEIVDLADSLLHDGT